MRAQVRIAVGLLLLAAIVACDSSTKRKRRDRDDEGGAAGEAGAAASAGGSSGSVASGGNAGNAVSSGGGAGETETGGSSSGGSSGSGTGGNGTGGNGTGGGGGTNAVGGSGGMDPCLGVDCSERGQCVESDGQARCECDPGFAPRGLECVACATASGTYDIDVPMVVVSGDLSVNGQPVTTSADARISFVTPGGDSVLAANLNAATYSVGLVPGTYDVVYGAQTHDELLPDNVGVTILEDVRIDVSGVLNLDVPMAVVSGDFTVNGEPVSTTGDAMIYFMRGNDVAVAGYLSDSSYTAEIVPGTYDVYYTNLYEDDEAIPRNQAMRVLEDVTIDGDGVLDVDIPMVTLSGNIRVNGESAVTGAETGLALFSEFGTVRVGTINDLAYSFGIIPGVYDVRYNARSSNDAAIPRNEVATILEDVTIEETRSLNIDVPMVTITGNVTVNGAPVTTKALAFVRLLNAAGDYVELAAVGNPAFSTPMVPGTYDVYYVAESHDDGLPDNSFARLHSAVVFDQDGNFDIDIPMVVVSGVATVNGEPPGSAGDAIFYFVGPDNDTVLAANVDSPTYTAEFVPGTYDVFYAAHALDESIPSNQVAPVLDDVVIDGAGTVDLDVSMVSISGNVTLNGMPVTTSGEGVVHFTKDVNDSLEAAYLSSPTYSAQLVPGTYNLVYSARFTDTAIPGNLRAQFGCVQIE